MKAEESRLSLMVQNDAFVASDSGGYISGIALSRLRSVSPGQSSIAPLPVIWTGIGANRYADSDTAELRRTQSVAVAGVAYGLLRASVSFSLQSASPLITSTDKRELYGSLVLTVPW